MLKYKNNLKTLSVKYYYVTILFDFEKFFIYNYTLENIDVEIKIVLKQNIWQF